MKHSSRLVPEEKVPGMKSHNILSFKNRPWLEGVAWYLIFAVIALVSFRRFFPMPYAFDDMAVLQFLGFYRAHQYTFTDGMLITHNEHMIPLVRLMFLSATRLWGFDATGLRVVTVLLHAVGAWTVAMMALLTAQSRLAAFLGGCLYATACSCVASPVWVLTALNFLIPAVALQMGLLAIFRWRGTIRGLVLAGVAVVVAAAALGFAVLPALMLIPAGFLWGPKSRATRSGFAGGLALFCIGTLIFARWDYTHYAHRPFPSTGIHWQNLGALAWLWISPLGRLPWAMIPGLALQYRTVGIISAIVAALLVWIWRWLAPETKKLIAVSWLAHVLMMVPIGLGRGWSDPWFLSADRYAYFAMVPLCLQLAAVYAAFEQRCGQSRPRLPALVAAGIAFIAFVGNQIRLNDVMPWEVFKLSSLQNAQAIQIALQMKAEGAKSPLVIENVLLPFEGTETNGLLLTTIFYTQYPSGDPNVKFVRAMTPDQKKRIDAIVEACMTPPAPAP